MIFKIKLDCAEIVIILGSSFLYIIEKSQNSLWTFYIPPVDVEAVNKYMHI